MENSDKKKYVFHARKQNKAVVRGEILAANAVEARAQIEKHQLDPIQVLESQSPLQRFLVFLGKPKTRISNRDLEVFTKKLSRMTRSGVSILQGLNILSGTSENSELRGRCKDLANSIKKGLGLHLALAEHPNVFSETYISIVKAGEASGTLTQSLDHLGQDLEKKEALRKQVRGAMAYPAVASILSFAVIALMMIFVVPGFQSLFASSNKDLPAVTQLVVDISSVFRQYWWAVFSLPILLFLLFRSFLRSPSAKLRLDRLRLKLPIFGKIHQLNEVIFFCRTTSSMIAAGIHLPESLEYGRNSMKNSTMSESIREVKELVIQGSPLSEAFSGAILFPKMMGEMLTVGENSGALDEMLSETADFFEDDLNLLIQTSTKMMEPLFTLGIGVLIGFILVAMYMPIFKLSDLL